MSFAALTYVKKKSVIVSVIFFLSSIAWWLIGAWGSADFVLQKLGASEQVSGFLGSQGGQVTLVCVSLVVVVGVLLFHVNDFFARAPVQAEGESKPEPVEPVFTEGIDHLSVSIGSNSTVFPIANLEHQKLPFFIGNVPATIYAENGKPFVDVEIVGGQSLVPVRLVHNELRNRPANWDVNSDDKAIEVVDANGRPVFQLYFTSPSQAVVCGWFKSNGQSSVATENCLTIGPTGKRRDYQLRRIFRYPSHKHKSKRLRPAWAFLDYWFVWFLDALREKFVPKEKREHQKPNPAPAPVPTARPIKKYRTQFFFDEPYVLERELNGERFRVLRIKIHPENKQWVNAAAFMVDRVGVIPEFGEVPLSVITKDIQPHPPTVDGDELFLDVAMQKIGGDGGIIFCQNIGPVALESAPQALRLGLMFWVRARTLDAHRESSGYFVIYLDRQREIKMRYFPEDTQDAVRAVF